VRTLSRRVAFRPTPTSSPQGGGEVTRSFLHHASLLGRAFEINDPVEYKKYTDLVRIIANTAAKVLARGGRYRSWKARISFSGFVVTEFPTFEQGVACFQSDEYDSPPPFRRANGAGEVETIMVDGGDANEVNGCSRWMINEPTWCRRSRRAFAAYDRALVANRCCRPQRLLLR